MASEKIKNNLKSLITYIAVVLLGGIAAVLIFKIEAPGSVLGVDLTALILLTILVKFLGWIPLNTPSCLLLYLLLNVEMVIIRGDDVPFEPFIVLFLLLDVGILLIWQTGHLRKYAIGISLTVAAAAIMLSAYKLLMSKLMPEYYSITHQVQLSPIQKMVVLITLGLLFILIFVIGFRILRRILRKWNDSFHMISEKLAGIEIYVLMIVVFTVVFWAAIRSRYYIADAWNSQPAILVWIQIFIFLMDVIYICLLVRTVSIKEKMRVALDEKNIIAAYSADLETNLDHLHEVRHDAKNLFLTMGSFVERSDDNEMKGFYRQNVVPFMQETLIKNELHAKLRILQDDRLKSFLYYKLTEKIEKGIHIRLEITSPVRIDTGYGDMIRLLAILIDNAAEEAGLIEGTIELKMTEDETGIHISIGNDIRPETRSRGVIAGTTDKGIGRGRGLIIARKIIDRYENIVLNSYFTETQFVQHLIIVNK